MTIKKILAISLALVMAFCLGACKTKKDSQTDKKKGARDNVIISENPRTEENLLASSEPKSSEEESSSEPEKDTVPEETTTSLLSAIQSGKRENIQAFADYNTMFNLMEGQDADWLLRQVLLRLNYEIISSDVGEDKATVTVKVSNLDMNLVLPLYFEQAGAVSFENASEGLGKTREELDVEYRKIFVDLLIKYENTRRDRIAEVELENKDGKWQIVASPVLGDVVLGGFLEAQEKVRGDMQAANESSSDASATSKASSMASSGSKSGLDDEYSDINYDTD